MEVAAYRQPSLLRRKRASAGCEAFSVEKEAAFAVGNMPDAERAREVVRQRFQAELVAVRRLLEKAAAVPVPRSESTEPPPAKRSKKASTSPAVARKIMAVEEEEEEDVDIVGGVSPMVTAPAPLQLAEDDEEYVDICGDASPVVMPKNPGDDDATISGSPSSSSSSDSDGDESVVDSPAPAERDGTPPTMSELIARAKESLERQRKEARSKAREKARQEVLRTERAAMPDDETIHPTVLERLHVVDQYNRGNLLRRLGLFRKADDYGIQDEEEQDHRRQSFQEDEDLEEGEIRV